MPPRLRIFSAIDSSVVATARCITISSAYFVPDSRMAAFRRSSATSVKMSRNMPHSFVAIGVLLDFFGPESAGIGFDSRHILIPYTQPTTRNELEDFNSKTLGYFFGMTQFAVDQGKAR